MKTDKNCKYAERDYVGDIWCLKDHNDCKWCDIEADYCTEHRKENNNDHNNNNT